MPEPSSTPARRIVIVETPGEARDAWKSALEAAGWAVACCDNAADATRRLEREVPNVVVAEIGLRPAGGLELLRLVKTRWPSTQVVCTALEHDLAHVLECLRGFAADYLRRPFEADHLVRAVKEAAATTPDDETIEIEMGEMGWIELRMPSSERCMRRLDKFFRLLYEAELSPDTLEEISLCFVEVVRNAIEWGHRCDVTKRIRLSHMLFQDEIVFKVEDTGSGFDIGAMLKAPEDLVAMETEREEAGKRAGGLGITMVRGMMDSVIYNRTGNMIVMSKKLYDAD